ncbi:MAG TPA: hypothetical protein P5255_13125 [Phycisphaerae bacterium]|nr:hypothetical protein [Phycisphaerae bacterium]
MATADDGVHIPFSAPAHMTATIEPTHVTAGDTLAWNKSFADYPANAGWTLKYRLINAAAKIDITSSASGADHAVNVAAATSAAWAAGKYSWQSWVEKGSERYTQAVGEITINRNLAAEAAGYDTRTDAKKILDQLMTAYMASTASKAFVGEYSIGDRRMVFHKKSDWILELNYWKGLVYAEKQAQRLSEGLGSGSKVYVRF